VTLFFFGWDTVAFAVPGLESGAVQFATPSKEKIWMGAEDFLRAFEGEAVLEESYVGPEGNESAPLIYIQESHADYETQVRIGKLLQKLSDREAKPIRLFLEGSAFDPRPELFRIFEEKERNEAVMDYLMRRGEVSGAERFLVENAGKAAQAFGVESAEAYRENLAAFREVYQNESEAAKRLSSLGDRLDSMRSRIASKELQGLLGLWLQEKRRILPLRTYLKELR
jgi:hypothetical protein